MRILTGVKPTGNGMHLGNYLGMFQPFIKNTEGKEGFLFLPDFHSLTSVHDGAIMRRNKHRLAAELLALKSDNANFHIFEQSQMSYINDITWILSSVTPYSLMLRAHSFKDSQSKNRDINMAVFNYPILMAADIIAYDIDIVPVGKDQKQHLEFARDIAQNFNNLYGVDFFKLPEALIDEGVKTIPGTDGRKMSKSYGNIIGIFDDEETLKKQIMSIVTDDTPLEEPKNPDTCNVFQIIKYFTTPERQHVIKEKYLAGGYGYGHAKLELLDIILDHFSIPREKYNTYMNNYNSVEKELEAGNNYAQGIITEKYKVLRNIVGLS